MKFLHTSDLHLGQIFNEYDRTPEHHAFFRRLISIVSRERPDALLVSGDIYHNSIPSAQTQKLYTDSVLALKEACPEMSVVITAGNHDSGARLEVDRNLWNHLNVKVIGGLSKKDGKPDLEKHIIEIKAKDGTLSGYVIALPHIYRQNYPEVDDRRYAREGEDKYALRQRAFYRKLMDMVSERNRDGLPVVIMAHLAVTGCDITGHDEPIGGMEYTPLSAFPEGYDYLALGHIHHPQFVAAGDGPGDAGVMTSVSSEEPVVEHICRPPVARYSGSPLHVSFDEDYPHSVSIVEIPAGKHDGKTITVKEIEIPETVPMVTLPSVPVPSDEAVDALLHYPDNKAAYIRLNILVRDYIRQNVAVDAAKATEGKKCRYCYMKVTREGRAAGKDTDTRLTVAEIRSMSPLDVAKMYYRKQFSSDMDEDFEAMLEQVARDIETEGSDRQDAVE